MSRRGGDQLKVGWSEEPHELRSDSARKHKNAKAARAMLPRVAAAIRHARKAVAGPCTAVNEPIAEGNRKTATVQITAMITHCNQSRCEHIASPFPSIRSMDLKSMTQQLGSKWATNLVFPQRQQPGQIVHTRPTESVPDLIPLLGC